MVSIAARFDLSTGKKKESAKEIKKASRGRAAAVALCCDKYLAVSRT